VSLDNYRSWSETVATWIQVIAILGGGMFALVEYRGNVERDRINRNLDFVRMFNESHMINTRIKLSSMWRDVNSKAFEGFPKLASAEVQKKFFRKRTIKYIKEMNIHDEVEILLGFFSSFSICLKQNYCEQKTARMLFYDDFKNYWIFHMGYIEETFNKKGNLEHLVKSFDLPYGSEPIIKKA